MNTPIQTPQSTAKRTFTVAETVFSWLCIPAGYLFCRAFPASDHPFGAFMFIVFLFCTTAIILAVNNAKFGTISIISTVSALLFAASLIFTENGFIHFFSYLYCIASYGIFVYTAYGNNNSAFWANFFLLDFFKALFISPFQAIMQMGNGLISNGKINTKPLLKILAGVAFTVLPTCIIVALLSYDNSFTDLLSDIFDFKIKKILSHIGSIILGVPIGMYIYGMFISSADKKCKNMILEDKVKNSVLSVKFVPQITVLSAVFPILAVYVLFFISQWKYYVSGFVGVLPDEMSYADYARDGFFQLCAVSVINFLIILAIGVFTRRKKENSSLTERILSTVLSVFTLVLIATALAKMVMYIDIYGLTQKRVYATWFMIVLALVFVLVIIKQFSSKLPLLMLSVCVVTVMFSVLAFAQTDKIIAEYNVDRYLDGSLEDIDTVSLIKLGDADIPSLVRVVHAWDEENGTDVKEYYASGIFLAYKERVNLYPDHSYRFLSENLKAMAQNREKSFWGYTLLETEADKALAEIGLDNITEKAKEE